MRLLRLVLPVLIATLAIAPSATAQETDAQERVEETGIQAHRGWWIGFGLGGGWNTSTTLDGKAEAGMGAYGRAGRTVSQRFLVGLESLAWIDAQIVQAIARTNTTLMAMFYPSRSGGLYLKGGIGMAHVQWATPLGADKETGGAVTLGIGFDIRLGSNLYLTPNVDFLFQAVDIAGVETENSITLFTLGLVWH